jgi:hypothetical protein
LGKEFPNLENKMSKEPVPTRAWWLEFDSPVIVKFSEIMGKVKRKEVKVGEEVTPERFQFIKDHLATSDLGEPAEAKIVMILDAETQKAWFFLVEF